MKIILTNITWNSKNWKKPSEDVSGHAWVGGDNVPHESWNFDLDNVRNPDDKVYGFAKFTHPPKVEGTNNLIVFYSQNKIVGFYGKAEILKEIVTISNQESYNLIGEREFAVVLENKIENLKDKGYLENKERVGQVGFSYLENTETILSILDEALELNPTQYDVINKLKSWVESNNDLDLNDEERLINRLADIGFKDAEEFYFLMELIIRELNLLTGDKRICYSLPKNKLIGLTIGQKYCAIIDIKGNKNTYRYFDTSNKEKNWLKEAISVEGIKNEISTILFSAKNELGRTDKTGYSNHSSPSLEKSLFNKEYKTYIFSKAFNKNIKNESMNFELNQILFGPPGTGKTYNTINEAIKIADPEFYKANHDNRDELKKRFKLLLLNKDNEKVGQIGFTTFHQSMSYEDFIEGIKPVLDNNNNGNLKYEIQEGIFKHICTIASENLKAKPSNIFSLTEDEFQKAHFFKMSLGNSQLDDDKEIFDYCIENNCITIGFGDQLDFSNKDEKEILAFGKQNQLSDEAIRSMNYFKNYLKKDNYVLISKGNSTVRAIGKVTGDYYFNSVSPFDVNPTYNHFRSVEWITSKEEISVSALYHKLFMQKTIYKLIKDEIKKDFFVQLKEINSTQLPKTPKNFVLIIDEINRGNVSSIFGELITLIEKDKRAGADEELSVILPYSKEEFKVPKNVYIIGTMNTADRSIEALDTALRRRFSFREMPPKSFLLAPNRMFWELLWKYKDVSWEHLEYKPKEDEMLSLFGASDKLIQERKSLWQSFKKEGRKETQIFEISESEFNGVNLRLMLETINNRIEKLIDKDHKIGHSYFLGISNETELKAAFKDKVIPLLEEYFFGDFGKISLVLGSSFITKTAKANVTFAKKNEYEPSITADLLDRSVYEVTSQDNWDFKAIYD